MTLWAAAYRPRAGDPDAYVYGLEDPETVATIVRDLDAAHRLVTVAGGLGALGLLILSAVALSGTGGGWGTVAGVVAMGGMVALAAAILVQPVVARGPLTARRILGAEPWRLAEARVVAGCPDDRRARVLVLLDPESRRPAGSWLVDPGRRGRWLVPDETIWCFVAASPDGSVAVVASSDRRCMAHLRRTVAPGISPRLHAWAWELVDRLRPLPASPEPRAERPAA
jgi:hypothetical protein